MTRTMNATVAFFLWLAVIGFVPSTQAQEAPSQDALVRLPTSVVQRHRRSLPFLKSSEVTTSSVAPSSKHRGLLQRTDGPRSLCQRSRCGLSRASFLLRRACPPMLLPLASIPPSHLDSDSISPNILAFDGIGQDCI